jgi:hypothetical protein
MGALQDRAGAVHPPNELVLDPSRHEKGRYPTSGKDVPDGGCGAHIGAGNLLFSANSSLLVFIGLAGALPGRLHVSGETPQQPARLYAWARRLMEGGCTLRDDGQMAESQLSELQNMRVLLEEARVLARNLAYHRRTMLETILGQALDEVDRQIEELRSEGRS